jgi:tetratricopeptide (TPR) repeat protein
MIAQVSNASRRMLLVTALAFAIPLAWAAPVDEAVAELQREWEATRYQAPAAERQKRFEALAARARQVSEAHAGRAEPLVWEGIIVSSLAGEKGGLGALSLVKQAKALYEQAIQIDGNVLDGSAYNSLGVLYYKVPGWPVGFGDKKKARELLQKALAINPKGIDPNYFFAEYLVETKHAEEALPYLERALQAPPRPGRPVADQGRKEEAKVLMEKVKGH